MTTMRGMFLLCHSGALELRAVPESASEFAALPPGKDTQSGLPARGGWRQPVPFLRVRMHSRRFYDVTERLLSCPALASCLAYPSASTPDRPVQVKRNVCA